MSTGIAYGVMPHVVTRGAPYEVADARMTVSGNPVNGYRVRLYRYGCAPTWARVAMERVAANPASLEGC